MRGWKCYASGRGEFHVRTGQVMTDATLTCVVVLDMPLQSNHSVSHVSVNPSFFTVFSV